MDLSKYLETMKNLPDRFSNLAFWRGVRKLKDEMVKTFEYVGEWGTLVESDISRLTNNVRGLQSRLDSSFTVLDHTIKVTKPSNLYKIDQGVPVSSVPYPRVDNYMIIFTISDSRITNADIIESAAFAGVLSIGNKSYSITQPMPLVPYISGSTIHLICYPFPIYTENSNISIGTGNMFIYIRCRRIATT